MSVQINQSTQFDTPVNVTIAFTIVFGECILDKVRIAMCAIALRFLRSEMICFGRICAGPRFCDHKSNVHRLHGICGAAFDACHAPADRARIR